MAHIDPAFLVPWVRAELDALGEAAALDAHAARAQEDGLDPDEAELDAASDLAARRGLVAALEGAAAPLWLSDVREARGLAERVERSGPSCVASLRANPQVRFGLVRDGLGPGIPLQSPPLP